MSIKSSFTSQAEAKAAGWFSRRHQTDDAKRQNQLDHISKEQAKKSRALAQDRSPRKSRKPVEAQPTKTKTFTVQL